MKRKYKQMQKYKKESLSSKLAKNITKWTDSNIKSGEKLVRGHK